MTESTLNFSHTDGLFDRRYARPLTIIGVGAIGGLVAFGAAKMGIPNITVWDDDVVDSHNAPYTVYRPDDLGRQKVLALQELIREHANMTITAIPEKYHHAYPLKNTTVIACADTMHARMEVWDRVSGNATIDLLIDTRSARNYLELYLVDPNDPNDRKDYGKTFFPDEEGIKQACGVHGTMFGSMLAAGAVLSRLRHFWHTGKREWKYTLRCDTLETF